MAKRSRFFNAESDELENSYYQSLYWQAKTFIEMQAFEDRRNLAPFNGETSRTAERD